MERNKLPDTIKMLIPTKKCIIEQTIFILDFLIYIVEDEQTILIISLKHGFAA